MSGKKKYTTEDIRLYLEGKLSPAEMYALEKAALEDPFLADAIEGMQSYDDKEKFFAESNKLKELLRKRVNSRRRVVTLPVGILWKAAAVLLIVVTGVAIIIYTGENNQVATTEIAKTEKTPLPSRQPEKREQYDTVRMSYAKPQATGAARRSLPAAASAADSQPVLRESEVRAQADQLEMEALPESAQPESLPAATDTVQKTLQGRAAGVVANKARFKKDELNTSGKIIISETTRKRFTPENGWNDFENYISENLAGIATDSLIKGPVELTFIIKEGRPDNIKVKKSPSSATENEAIRVLNAGPSWKVIRGKSREVNLTIIF